MRPPHVFTMTPALNVTRETDDRVLAGGRRPAGFLALFMAIYTLAAVLLSSRWPLWLDEITQLIGTRDVPNLGRLLQWVAENPGGAPLAHLSQRLCLNVLGFSELAARVPSIVSSLVACAGLLIIARQLRLRAAVLAVVLFALLPLQLRYACEGRPYAQALAFGVAATAAFLELRVRRSLKSTTLYALLLAAAVYSQPFAAFVGAAHLVWCGWALAGSQRRTTLGLALIANAAAAAAFVPWLVFAAARWQDAVSPTGYPFLSILGILFRETCGSYAICVLLVLGAIVALRMPTMDGAARSFLLISIAVPIAGALAADVVAGYFVAARQFIFALPAIALLVATGFDTVLSRKPGVGWALCAMLALALIAQDASSSARPREDWAQATSAIEARTAQGDCLLAPEGPVYVFFQPALQSNLCPADLKDAREVVLAVTSYTTAAQIDGMLRRLKAGGFSPDPEVQTAGVARIRSFRRDIP